MLYLLTPSAPLKGFSREPSRYSPVSFWKPLRVLLLRWAFRPLSCTLQLARYTDGTLSVFVTTVTIIALTETLSMFFCIFLIVFGYKRCYLPENCCVFFTYSIYSWISRKYSFPQEDIFRYFPSIAVTVTKWAAAWQTIL